METQSETSEWYRAYYARCGDDRNDPLADPGVLWQIVAHDAAIARVLQSEGVPPTAAVLDVGCGSGAGLVGLLRLGFGAETLVGVDLLNERIAQGHARLPGLDLRQGDATDLAFPNASFDVAIESTMFAQLTDNALRAKVAGEMARVVKPGGLILLADWRYTRPSDKSERGLSRRAVRGLFDGLADLERTEPAALAPPLGRRLSAHAPSLYLVARKVAPFAVAQVVYVLRAR